MTNHGSRSKASCPLSARLNTNVCLLTYFRFGSEPDHSQRPLSVKCRPSSPLVELPKHFHGRNVLILEWDDRVGGLAKPVN